MKRLALATVLALALGCSEKPIDLTPGNVHEGIEFKVIPLQAKYKHGEPVRIKFQLTNVGKKEVPIMVDYRNPGFGLSYSRVLKGNGVEYENLVPPTSRPNPNLPAMKPTISNMSFMLLEPGKEGMLFADSIREVAPKGGKAALLPPGTYTYVGEYTFSGNRKGTYTEGGSEQSMPFEGDGKVYYGRAPRGVWRAECTFIVTAEKAAPPGRPPRGGRPMGG